MTYAQINSEPNVVLVQTAEQWINLVRNNHDVWTAKDIEVSTDKTDGVLNIWVSATKASIKRIVFRWRHSIETPVKILGDHWERGYGDLEWRGIVPERVLPWYFLINDEENTFGYGVKTAPAAMCFWQISKQDITLCLDVRCGGEGVCLGGRKLKAASVVSEKYCESPFVAAKAFCKLMCDKPIIPSKPIYGGNNWYYAYGKSSHKEILDDSMRISDWAGSNENRPYMVIDDGWQLCHGGQIVGNDSFNGGPWTIGNSKFPDMSKLAFQMKESGVKPGIWFRPLLTAKKVHESNILKRTSQILYLDPSVEDVLNMVAEDIETMVSWGFELIKHDFSTYDIFGRWGFQMKGALTDCNWSFSDKSRTTVEIILDFYRRIRKAAGDINIIGCNTVGHLAAGIFDIQRTGDDTSGVEWERTRKMGVNTLAFRMPQHETFFAVDADCAAVTKNIPWRLSNQWLKLLSESGTPLFISAAPDAVGKDQTLAIRKAFDSASKPIPMAEPLDWFNTTCPGKWLLNGKVTEFDWDDIEREPIFKEI